MRLMRLADAPASEADLVFRYSPARALGLVFVLACVAGGLLVFGWRQHSGLSYYLAGVLVVGVAILRRFILARFQPSNWLVRVNAQGMFVQFRSYLNHRLARDDATVVLLARGEVRRARQVRESRDIPYRDPDRPFVERSTLQRRRLVELDLTGDVAALAQALAAEAARRPANATLYRHYPVRMVSDCVMQLEWGVVPGPELLLEALRAATDGAAPVEEARDLINLEELSRAQQDKRLLELAESGQMIAAIYSARKLHAFDLTQARAYVESLRTVKGGDDAADTISGRPER